MLAMARPVVVVVDAEDASRQALARELEGRTPGGMTVFGF